jgi:endonuclease YncB( thermonuclease family)
VIARLLVALLACWTAHVVGVERVIDGDSVVLELAIWPKVVVTETVRVLGVDAPERADLLAWRKARGYTEEWLRTSGTTTVRACKRDSFGRLLGTVVSQTHGDLAAALITAGHGQPYERR